MYEDLIIHFDERRSKVSYFFSRTEIKEIEQIVNDLAHFTRKKNDNPEITLLVNSGAGLYAKEMALTKPKLDIASNYNDDFLPIHDIILQRLNQENDKGLVLLHGKPGQVIFLPPDMATAITSPDLIALLMDNCNSILVIEDAEKIIVDREVDGHSPVSALLNLADGLLSDCLNIQIICSFNTNLSKVDKALLRRGRLIAKYEFKELEAHKAQELSNKLGFKTTITQPMTLTAIYNQEEEEFKQVERANAVGFSLEGTG